MFLPQFLVNILVIPLLLLKVNYRFSLKTKQKVFILDIFLVIIASMIGHGLSYLNWGITTGYLKEPDPATLGIVQLQVIIGLIVIVIGGLMYHRKLQGKF
jgi:hypothetical protein